MIEKCKNCETSRIKHAFQDKAYGRHVRVMNRTQIPDGQRKKVRCTVCGKEQ